MSDRIGDTAARGPSGTGDGGSGWRDPDLSGQRLAYVGAAVEATREAIGISDAQGRHVYQNRALSELFGYATAEELEAAGGGPATVKDPAVAREMFDAITQGKSWAGELEMVKKDGTVFTAYETADAIFDATGNLIGLIGVITDITERKRTEETLRLFERLVQHSSDAIGMATPDGTHYFQNEAFDRLFGDIGNTPHLTVYVDEAVGKQVFETIMAGGHWRGEVEMYARDRRVLNVLVRAFAIKDEGGRVLGLVGLHTDITERKRAERALQESEQRLQDVTYNLGDWVWEVDEKGVYTYSSARGQDMFGDAIGRTPLDFMPPEEGERVAKLFADLASRRAPISDLENWNTTRDGRRVCLLTNGVPILDAEGRLKGYRGVDKDITGRKQAEAEKAALEAQLQQAQKLESVGRLAGGVAHDFNNMLGVILGHAELAMDRIDPADPLYSDLAEIRAAANRSADLVRQLLAFARKQTVAPRVVDLNEVVASSVKMLQRLIGEQIDLISSLREALWPVRVDTSQVEQMLTNLCVNARDAITGVGAIVIETVNVTLTEADCAELPGIGPGDYVRLAVRDNGRGMDAETQSHIFEPFFTTKGVGQGTGLGLATVYGAVHQNGGAITVQSTPGMGTTVTIYLPRHRGAPDDGRATGGLRVRRGGETILLVEDEPRLLKIITAQLARQGYDVLVACTPAEALDVARARASDIRLLITDVVMPQMDGRALAQRLRSICPALKSLFMSGYTADIIALHGVLEEGVAFVQKPFTADVLAARVRQVLDSTS
jgi:two-component system, cell cycle sensor histidine kinase and response regulator CckA